MAYDRVRDEYASWCAVPEDMRALLRLPPSQAEFARIKQVTTRTLQRWQKDEEFQAVVAKRRAKYEEDGLSSDAVRAQLQPRQATDPRVVRKIMDSQVASAWSDAVGESEDETEYLRVRARIVTEAENGDQRAQDLYMKYWGASWVEQEQSTDDQLAVLSDEELTDRVLSLLGVEAVSGWLEGRAAA